MPVEGRGLCPGTCTKAVKDKVIDMSLVTPEKIRELQRKLYLKAKREPEYRFYSLYDKVCREDIISHAYMLSKSRKGAPGVDGTSFSDIESYGRKKFLMEIQEELLEKRYRCSAVLRVRIPKPDGGERLLGIPTIKDRVVQTAVRNNEGDIGCAEKLTNSRR